MTASTKYQSSDTTNAENAYRKAHSDWESGNVPTRTMTASRDRWHRAKAKDAEVEKIVRDALSDSPATDEAVASVCAIIESRAK